MGDQLERFWQQEELRRENIFSKEEQECEEHFRKTHSSQESGRFILQLLLKKSHTQLSESHYNAKKDY